jgi:threonine/homoserine/homoserine lactone efflux protein
MSVPDQFTQLHSRSTAHRARRWLNGDRVRRYMDCFTSTVLVAFGLKLALSRP